jgi:hypothetical protein
MEESSRCCNPEMSSAAAARVNGLPAFTRQPDSLAPLATRPFSICSYGK